MSDKVTIAELNVRIAELELAVAKAKLDLVRKSHCTSTHTIWKLASAGHSIRQIESMTGINRGKVWRTLNKGN